MSDEYFVAIPMKIRIADLAGIDEAARSEIEVLRARNPQDGTLAEVAASPMVGLEWFLGATRLTYLFEGVEVLAEMPDITAASIFPPYKTGEHLHDVWIDEYPEYVGDGGPPEPVRVWGFGADVVGEDANSDSYTIGLSETMSGDGQYLTFSILTGEPGPGDTYSIAAPAGTYAGGLLECQIIDDLAVFVFTAEAAEALGADERVTVGLSDVSRSQRTMLKQGLRKVLTWGNASNAPHLNF
ncbi:hypothetical protein [Actinomadura mexicana]|uniref:Uncharacterized protein n=1 Tax=Actinomadura mexicana TaxID=134959 RepID=A0A238XFJ5_9ACTN|nr:hypothetical protein [Actinomadura mexicana]SNR57786.1 hypothetical protein SAMN06265355_104311 [Actinomadura mexicana]